MTFPARLRSNIRFKKVFRASLATIVLMCMVGAVNSLRAQEQPAAPQPQQQSSDSTQQPHGFGQQLAHDTREAAGEEKDETAVFKQSAAVRFIARITGLDLQHAYWLCTLLNFATIGGILFWAGRKYLPTAFRERTAGIQKAMQQAQKASEEARLKLAEIEERLKKLDVEIAGIRDAAEQEGVAEEARIKAAAEEDARKIIAAAEQEITAAAKAARRALTAYAADLAVALAQKQIHVDAATDQGLVRNFAGQLGSASGGLEDRTGDSGKGGH